MGVIVPLLLIVISGWVIWKASDGFESASAFIGRNLSNGVRGATINAIASSMPEFFLTLFFLFVLNDKDGFAGGMGTTAGSSLFNGMIIPACVIIAVHLSKMGRDIVVSRKLMVRDGIFLLIEILVLIFIVSKKELYWYHGMALMSIYLVYIVFLFFSGAIDKSHSNNEIFEKSGKKESFIMDAMQIDLYALVIGNKKFNTFNAWVLLSVSTIVMGASCMLLVHASEMLGQDKYTLPLIGEVQGLKMPILFVALIIAAAASSLPDTIISIKDAKKGNFNDAISCALGSNIFDIGFALGFPLFIYGILRGSLDLGEKMVSVIIPILWVLFALTVLSFLIYVIGKRMSKTKAIMLIFSYLIFVVYAAAKSLSLI